LELRSLDWQATAENGYPENRGRFVECFGDGAHLYGDRLPTASREEEMKKSKMHRLTTASLWLAAGWLFACMSNLAAAPVSHPPLRQSPAAAKRPLGDGPNYFVDPAKGSDAADGSEQKPWKSIGHAVKQLRAGDTLCLRGGIYYERVYLALAGTPGSPITIRSYPGEQAVIDGSFAEFTQQPATAWRPLEGGARGEYVSAQTYANIRDVVGSFGDSLIGLQTYYYSKDLRSEGELIDWENWDKQQETDLKPLYCGPGLWLDRATGRIHCRLAHTHLPEPIDNYRGETDPRKLPLIVAPFDSVPLTLDACQHLRLQDLEIRGAGYTSIEVRNCKDLEIDGATVWCGTYGFRFSSTEGFKLLNSRLYGSLAPWTFRNDASKRDYPGRPHRNISRLNTHALIEIDSGRESSVFAFPQNDRWEIAGCHFTDAHDGLYLGAINCRFHHNLIENLQDDGIYLSPMYLRHRLEATDPTIQIDSNTFRQLLTPIAFGGDRPETADQVFICRNVFDLRHPVRTGRPSTKKPEPGFSTGKPLGDHGSPPWSAMNIYHNTFIMSEPARDAAMNTLGSTRDGHPRRTFNNLFIHLARLPGFVPPAADQNVISDGNWYWSPVADEKQTATLLDKYLKSPAHEQSKQAYPPGCEANSHCRDPKLRQPPGDLSKTADFALSAESPAIDAGVPIPADWPDPERSEDAGKPDVGAFPLQK
jgi:hypothetical protein